MVRVYSKPACGACASTKTALTVAGIEFEEISLNDAAPELINEFLEAGLRSAPIVVTDSDRWAGFQPNKIMELAV